jgi:hypothetical protein
MYGHSARGKRIVFTQPVLEMISARVGFAKAFAQAIIG